MRTVLAVAVALTMPVLSVAGACPRAHARGWVAQPSPGRQAAVAVGKWVAVLTAQAHPDFSGAWVLDRNQSQVPPAGEDRFRGTQEAEGLRLALVISQTETELKIERLGANAEPIVLGLDGRERTWTGPRGGTVRTRTHWEGPVLVTETTREVNGPNGRVEVSGREERRLSEDGQKLMVASTSKGPKGDQRRTLVFVRKS